MEFQYQDIIHNMPISKRDIARSISEKSSSNKIQSSKILECFLDIIKKNSKHKHVKISGFGTFYYKKTPKRVGRNPKTKESYIIAPMKKLYLSTSNGVKKQLN